MKFTLTLLLAAFTMTAVAQNNFNRAVGDFNELKVFDLIEVNLIQSSENKVVVKGKNTESVKVINDNGVLKIRMELEERFDGNETFLEVYFKNIDVIDANEGAVIVASEMIEQNTIELRSQEGGSIKVGLKVNHAKIKAVTGGIVESAGLAKSQEVVLNTGGIYEGRELQTEDTEISVTAAGDAEVYASQKVKVRVTAGGDVRVFGNPERVDKKSIVGGTIEIVQ
jgi:hypothetical protein